MAVLCRVYLSIRIQNGTKKEPRCKGLFLATKKVFLVSRVVRIGVIRIVRIVIIVVVGVIVVITAVRVV
jgi:hypothetical protein